MKVLALADVHQSEKHWVMLEEAVRRESPALVLIAGDLLPKYEGILAQADFGPRLREHARAIKDSGAELVLILGNDDNQLLIPEMEAGDEEGLWHYLPDQVKKIMGYEFCGCPWIRDYPFAYKYWVTPESREHCFIHPVQLGPPAEISRNNQIATIADLETYLKGKVSVKESLEKMAAQVRKLEHSIWLIHDPPAYMGLDLCGSGDEAGSPVVYDFIWEKQPLLTIHGHIHESPQCNGGIWARQLDRTWCIQAGQIENELSYVTFELGAGEVKEFRHSLYGPLA